MAYYKTFFSNNKMEGKWILDLQGHNKDPAKIVSDD